MRHIIITLLAALATTAALAQSNGRIYIENFVIAPDSTVTVQVMLENVETTHGCQFKMALPDGLTLEETELTKYSRKLKMSQANNLKNGQWIVAVYSMNNTSFPPDNAAILTMTLTAQPAFEGGIITITKSMGSSEELTTIYYDDNSTTVTLAPGQ